MTGVNRMQRFCGKLMVSVVQHHCASLKAFESVHQRNLWLTAQGEIPSANRARPRKEAGREGGDLANGERGGGGDNGSAMINIRWFIGSSVYCGTGEKVFGTLELYSSLLEGDLRWGTLFIGWFLLCTAFFLWFNMLGYVFPQVMLHGTVISVIYFSCHFYTYIFCRRFLPKCIQSIHFIHMCVGWKWNPWPFTLVTQCSTSWATV